MIERRSARERATKALALFLVALLVERHGGATGWLDGETVRQGLQAGAEAAQRHTGCTGRVGSTHGCLFSCRRVAVGWQGRQVNVGVDSAGVFLTKHICKVLYWIYEMSACLQEG